MIKSITEEQRRVLLELAGAPHRTPRIHGATVEIDGDQLVLRMPLDHVVGRYIESEPSRGLGPRHSIELHSGVLVAVDAETSDRVHAARWRGKP